MGCLRSGFYFVFSLLAAAVCIVVGVFFGSFITLFNSTSQGVSISAPLDVVQANPTGALIGGGVGAVLGLLIMVRMMKRASDITWLKREGTRISAAVTKIERKSESYHSGNTTQYRTYYIVVAKWFDPRTRQTCTFRSDRRNFFPRNYPVGSNISVLIDPQNSGRYFVEF
ncbi:MAG TPA: hypothetical protein VGD98_06150 [Ktedonobacteraceae bacterium]